MSSKLITAAAGVGVAGALTLGVCVAATSASAATRPLTTYRVGAGHAVHGPSHVAPGFAGFHLVGAKHTLVQIFQSRSGAGKSSLIKDGGAANQGQVAALEDDFKSIGGSQAHGNDLYVKMLPGTYFIVDIDAKKLQPSMIQKVTASGPTVNAARPVADATLTSTGDMHWAPKPNHIPASGLLRFRNHSKSNMNNTHFVALQKLQPGKKYADVKKVLEGKEPFPQVFESGPGTSFGTGIISQGRAQVSTYSLTPGRYALLCFFNNRMTGTPHAFLGMYRTILVG